MAPAIAAAVVHVAVPVETRKPYHKRAIAGSSGCHSILIMLSLAGNACGCGVSVQFSPEFGIKGE